MSSVVQECSRCLMNTTDKDIELKIGEQLIDRQSGQYYDIYDEFYSSDDNSIMNINYMTSKNEGYNSWPPRDKAEVNEPTKVPL